MTGMWKINNKDIFSLFGAIVLKDSYLHIMAPPKPRKRMEYDYTDQDGLAVDMESPLSYEAASYNINVLIVGDDYSDFRNKFNAFFAEIATPEHFTLYVSDLGIQVTLLYEGATCLRKPRSLRSGRVAVSYQLCVKEYNPTLRVYDSH